MTAELLIEGRVATLAGDGSRSPDDLGIVDALAVASGRIVACGSRSDLEPLVGPRTRRIELAPDELCLPGLTDGHIHLADAAVATGQLSLAGAGTMAAALELVAAAHRSLGDSRAWLRGGGWDAGSWGAWSTAADLGRVAPGRAVLLWSHDLHAVWVSETVLALAGVTAATLDPSGGIIRRLADGGPAGVLHEDATHLVTRHAPVTSGDELAMLIERYARLLLRLGIIAVHDLGELETDSRLERGFAALGRLGAEGRLPVRVHAGIRRGALSLVMERGIRSGDPLGTLPSSTELGGGAKIGWLKLFGDGTLGSRTAALLEAYTPDAERGDPPGGPTGMLVTEPGEMRELAATAASAGLATSIHAIGDRAVRAALDALEPTSGRMRLRPRVEHVQLVDRDDLPRFGASGVVASVQPGHLAGDAANARRAWGERIERGYPWRDLLDGGASLVFGSDAPAGDVDPWPGLVLAVTRSDPGWPRTEPAFGPRQVITLGEAIRAACVAGPTAAGETDRGRLTVGQRADLIVVPAAILADMDALRVARPRLVMMDGRVVAES